MEWQPGSDRLAGTCHCGAVHLADGPAEVWDWLLGHSASHPAGHSESHPASHPASHTSVRNGVHT